MTQESKELKSENTFVSFVHVSLRLQVYTNFQHNKQVNDCTNIPVQFLCCPRRNNFYTQKHAYFVCATNYAAPFIFCVCPWARLSATWQRRVEEFRWSAVSGKARKRNAEKEERFSRANSIMQFTPRWTRHTAYLKLLYGSSARNTE